MYKDNSINLKKLATLFENNFKDFNASNGKQIVLVMGGTKSGKSTLINHMLGHTLKFGYKTETDMRQSYYFENNPATPFARMGEHIDSETTHPKLYSASNGVIFCDCPGFFDNRHNEQSIFASCSTEYTIKAAASLAGIIVVIDYSSLTQDLALAPLCEAIGKIFGATTKDSITVVLTKIPEDNNLAVEEFGIKVSAYLENFATTKKSVAITGTDPQRIQQGEFIRKGVDFLQYAIGKKRFVVSRKQEYDKKALFRILDSLIPIVINTGRELDFTSYDKRRNYMNQWLASIIQSGIDLKEQINSLEQKIDVNNDLDEILKRKEILNKNFSENQIRINHYKKKIEDIASEISSLEIERKKNQLAIEEDEKNQLIQEKNIEDAESEISRIEKIKTPCCLKIYPQNVREVKNGFWEEALSPPILYDNSAVPYYDVTLHPNPGGEFELIKEDKEKGYYLTRYRVRGAWFSGKTHTPYIMIWYYERYSLDNRNKVKECKETQATSMAKLKEIKSKLTSLKAEREGLKFKPNRSKEREELHNLVLSLEATNNQMHKSCQDLNKEYDDKHRKFIGQNAENKKDLENKRRELSEQKETYRMIIFFSAVFDFPDELKQKLVKFVAAFSGFSAVKSSSSLSEEYQGTKTFSFVQPPASRGLSSNSQHYSSSSTTSSMQVSPTNDVRLFLKYIAGGDEDEAEALLKRNKCWIS